MGRWRHGRSGKPERPAHSPQPRPPGLAWAAVPSSLRQLAQHRPRRAGVEQTLATHGQISACIERRAARGFAPSRIVAGHAPTEGSTRGQPRRRWQTRRARAHGVELHDGFDGRGFPRQSLRRKECDPHSLSCRVGVVGRDRPSQFRIGWWLPPELRSGKHALSDSQCERIRLAAIAHLHTLPAKVGPRGHDV